MLVMKSTETKINDQTGLYTLHKFVDVVVVKMDSEQNHKTEKTTQYHIGGNILSKRMYIQLPQAKASFAVFKIKPKTINR
jgi:hypothetical protein